MKDTELPQPDKSWPESARSAYQTLILLVQKQTELVHQQNERILKQEATIQALKERLSLNSKNSNKPPSSDRKDKNKAKRKRKASAKTRGGQPGHKGSSRKLLEPTVVIPSQAPIDSCICGEHDWIPRGKILRHQVTELPEILPEVIEYQRQSYDCRCCGQSRFDEGPLKGTDSQFGPRLHAHVISLYFQSRLSMRQIQSHLQRLCKLSISVGAISGIIKRTGTLSKRHYDELKEWFQRDTQVKHVDETGWRVGGESATLIGSLNEHIELFQISKTRKRGDVQALLGEDKSRLPMLIVEVCDRAKVYYFWSNRQLCWAHVFRTFDFLAQSHGCKAHGKRLVQNAESLFRYSRKYRTEALSEHEYLSFAQKIRMNIQLQLNQLNESLGISSLARGKIKKLIEHEAQLWTFLKHPELKIHNNDQERALRTAVIKRKLSFGNDTWDGAHTFAQLLSAIQTLKRQKRSVKEWFISLFESQSPSLIPTF